MDDKTGLWVVVEAIRRAVGKGLNGAEVVAVSTVQEEVGLRGAKTSAHAIQPDVGIAVDVTFATDCPTMDKQQNGDVRLQKGPVIYRGPNMNHRVVQRLVERAKSAEIPFQMAAEGRATGTDANAIQVTGRGVAAGLVSIPNRYMHSPVEMVSEDDLDHAANLLAEFCCSVVPGDDFTPRAV
jgi:endoglucanase